MYVRWKELRCLLGVCWADKNIKDLLIRFEFAAVLIGFNHNLPSKLFCLQTLLKRSLGLGTKNVGTEEPGHSFVFSIRLYVVGWPDLKRKINKISFLEMSFTSIYFLSDTSESLDTNTLSCTFWSFPRQREKKQKKNTTGSLNCQQIWGQQGADVKVSEHSSHHLQQQSAKCPWAWRLFCDSKSGAIRVSSHWANNCKFENDY